MAELIPRRVLFGNPERVMPRISPDGSRLAWIAPHEGVLNVWVAPTGADGVGWAQAQVVTDDTDRGIRMFAWAHDGRHLMYLQDTGGDENWRLHDVDLETMQRRDLTPFDDVQTQIIATEKKFPTEIERNQTPMVSPAIRAGASLVIALKPTGLRHSSPTVWIR